ncbi:MAG: diguanylate cyclase [Sterolibacterium sp.]|nr:diguanylate cyclase [Sterolibacterium sp.]
MSTPPSPSEIARDVLRQLAARRKLPTPDNYTALYNEIAGAAAVDVFPEKPMKTLAAALPRTTAEQVKIVRQFETGVEERNWKSIQKALLALATPREEKPLQWSPLIRELAAQLERNHAELTSSKKRETLEHLLKSTAAPELLHTRLQSLLRAWAQGSTAEEFALVEEINADAPDSGAASAPPPVSNDAAVTLSEADNLPESGIVSSATLSRSLREWLALLLGESIHSLLTNAPEMAGEARQLASEVRSIQPTAEAITSFTGRLKKFSYRLEFLAEDQNELRTALLHLLRLIIENIGEVVIDDRLLHGQIETLLELINQPLNLRQLDDVERRMKDVIYKQGLLKKQLTEAQSRLKNMLASFVDRLANMTDETDTFHSKIEICSKKINQAGDIGQISEVLDEVMSATRVMQLNVQRSRDELRDMRRRVEETEKEVERLHAELSQASEMVRIDPLTNVLNRKGMDEAMAREVSRAHRQHGKLCIAVLDIDNFKKLNDTLGHQAGDAALVHLATVIKDALRPQDTVARYGGEEFVLLLPDTPLDESVATVTRLQRELTRKFFLHNNEKLLITFSAGVAELDENESSTQAFQRADQAMYLAKRSGKNRVLSA